ncbi:MAG: RNA pyrophosphohydrolase [Chlamydiae bacterium]|nr:RNA pyrophosphohydrolase [Chlamydiota bacterium]
MSLPVRNSINLLLLNEKKQLLLMCADDPTTTTVDGKYHGRFWFPIGGKIEPGESLEEAALRELFEETGLAPEEVELGPIVWFGEFDLVLSGTPTRLKQRFIVAKTRQNSVSLSNLTQEEQAVIQKTAWFSLEEIKNCPDVIYPVLLPQYLPDILSGNYPAQPLEIDLGTQPR